VRDLLNQALVAARKHHEQHPQPRPEAVVKAEALKAAANKVHSMDIDETSSPAGVRDRVVAMLDSWQAQLEQTGGA
jgi:hypothetical protein